MRKSGCAYAARFLFAGRFNKIISCKTECKEGRQRKLNYEIGDYVMKPMTGVCKVDDVMNLNMDGVNKDKLYYLLVPLNDQREKIYVPVEKAAFTLRKCMTHEKAWEAIWIDNEKLREQKYKEAIKKNDPYALVSVIKMTYNCKRVRMQQGKKNIAADERYFHIAENLLYSELGFALDKPKDEICQLITQHIDGKKTGQGASH